MGDVGQDRQDATANLVDAFFERSPSAVSLWRFDPDDPGAEPALVAINAAARHRLEGTTGEAPLRFDECFPWAPPDFRRRIRESATGSLAQDFGELPSDTGAANSRLFRVRAIPLSDRNVAVVVDDLTERRAADVALEQTAIELQDLYDETPIGLHSLDAAGVFVRVNDTELRWLGYTREELVGKMRFADLLTPASALRFAEAFSEFLRRGAVHGVEFEVVRKDGTLLPVQVHATAVLDQQGRVVRSRSCLLDLRAQRRAEARMRDAYADVERKIAERTAEIAHANAVLQQEIEDRKHAELELQRTEQRLRQSQKTEALGRLAGGVAHDFNNVLSVVLSFTEFATDQLPADSPVREDLEQVRLAAERAAGITRQLLAFSRQHVYDPVQLDLNEVVASLDRMLRLLLGEDVLLTVRLAPAVGLVLADRALLEQAIVNLAVNARDAMPGGGRLLLETDLAVLGCDSIPELPGVQPGKYVRLDVVDTGIGMDEDTQARAFEPFFTTKDRSKGTGLGLSMVYGIVRQSNGHIQLCSAPSKGTTVTLYLPEHDATESDQPVQRNKSVRAPSWETILLAEDDDLVRRAVRNCLERTGYRVLDARDPLEALALCERHDGPIHLLLTDMVMPHLNGPDLAQRAVGLRPDLRVVYMSGYPEALADHPAMRDPDAIFLQKPLTPDALARTVRAALDDGSKVRV